MAISLVGQEFEQEFCESNLDPPKVAHGVVDDDGRPKRTGTAWTASAHIITAIIGSGVLSLAWAMAQLGWIAGIGILLIFSCITIYTSSLLADCYRSPDPATGKRNHTYMEAVGANLGGNMYKACGLVQYTYISGLAVGYTITASMSMTAVLQSNCFHKRGHVAPCKYYSSDPYTIGIGIIEIFMSQIPNLHKMSWVSVIAAIMSFGYASIGMGLSFAKLVAGHGARTTMTGSEVGLGLTAADKIWRVFRAIGDMVFGCTYAEILIEIQDTLKASSKPENVVMKKANLIAILTSTAFYMMCGCLGYAALGNGAPGNMLTGFGFYNPFWLIDLANIFIVVHLLGAYQVLSQPLFDAFESWASRRWPKSKFVTHEYPISIGKNSTVSINLLRLTWRTVFVVIATVLAMAMPFFNDVLSLLGAIGYWPMTVYFPVEMHIAQKKIQRGTIKWFSLQLLNLLCLLVAIAAACGAIEGLNHALKTYKPFKF